LQEAIRLTRNPLVFEHQTSPGPDNWQAIANWLDLAGGLATSASANGDMASPTVKQDRLGKMKYPAWASPTEKRPGRNPYRQIQAQRYSLSLI